ncbi:TonB-dependent receptor [Sesbania bispinosa]|nr:TonB-dependent receptor [Sesbania bispinosa]
MHLFPSLAFAKLTLIVDLLIQQWLMSSLPTQIDVIGHWENFIRFVKLFHFKIYFGSYFPDFFGEWNDDSLFPYWFDRLNDGIFVLALSDHSP